MNQVSMFCLVVMAGFISCGSDDDGSKYSFKGQDAAGKINGTSWTYVDGFSDITSGNVNVKLTLEQASGEGCGMGMPEGNVVIFVAKAEVGVYPLNLTTVGVTLIEDDLSPYSVAATDGAVEILTITETQVTGRIDARSKLDDETFVNGNFVVDICP